jgi:ribose transport system permease protein
MPEEAQTRRVKEWLLAHLTYVIFTLITVFFLIFSPNFATIEAAASILQITALVSIMAVGATFVIVCAEIDLSVGSLASFSGMIAAILMDRGLPGPVAVVLVFLLGAAIGMVNGLLVTRAKIPSFLVTLGMLSVLSGLALTVTNTMPVPIVDDRFNQTFLERAINRYSGACPLDPYCCGDRVCLAAPFTFRPESLCHRR